MVLTRSERASGRCPRLGCGAELRSEKNNTAKKLTNNIRSKARSCRSFWAHSRLASISLPRVWTSFKLKNWTANGKVGDIRNEASKFDSLSTSSLSEEDREIRIHELDSVGTGLRYAYWGAGLSLLALIGFTVVFFINTILLVALLRGIGVDALQTLASLGRVSEFVSTSSTYVFIVAGLLDVIGIYFCLRCPPVSGMKRVIYASASCKVIGVLLLLSLTQMDLLFYLGLPINIVFALITVAIPCSFLLSNIAWILFPLFLKQVSLYLGDSSDLANRFQVVVGMAIAFVVLEVISGIVLFINVALLPVVMFVILLLVIFLVIRYRNALRDLKERISQ